jgi:hypothetical protein
VKGYDFGSTVCPSACNPNEHPSILTTGASTRSRPPPRTSMGAFLRATLIIIVTAIFALLAGGVRAQSQVPTKENAVPDVAQTQQSATTGATASQSGTDAQAKPPAANPQTLPAAPNPQSTDSEGEQTKRIFWVIPNYRSVSANTKLPPLSTKEKFKLATEDSFDYSGFVLAGMIAGYSMAIASSPEFHQGAAGYGQYYWHSFVDEANGNYFTEAIVPALTHEDPRYYTLGHGGFLHRSGYAVSRLFITRTDSGGNTFNFSEIAGNLAGAGLSNAYYPAVERTFGKTAEKWGTQVGVDGIADLLKEFWPDIRHGLFHQ